MLAWRTPPERTQHLRGPSWSDTTSPSSSPGRAGPGVDGGRCSAATGAWLCLPSFLPFHFSSRFCFAGVGAKFGWVFCLRFCSVLVCILFGFGVLFVVAETVSHVHTVVWQGLGRSGFSQVPVFCVRLSYKWHPRLILRCLLYTPVPSIPTPHPLTPKKNGCSFLPFLWHFKCKSFRAVRRGDPYLHIYIKSKYWPWPLYAIVFFISVSVLIVRIMSANMWCDLTFVRSSFFRMN